MGLLDYMFPSGSWETAGQMLGLRFSKKHCDYWEDGKKVYENELVLAGPLEGIDLYISTYRGGHGRFRGNQGGSLATMGRSPTAKCMHLRASHAFIPPTLRIGRQGLFSSVANALGSQDVLVGDPHFDGQLDLEGHEAEIIALFDANTRRYLVGALGSGKYEVSQGTVTNDRPELIVDPPRLAAEIREIALVARTLCLDPQQIAARLHYSAQHDPVPHVRHRCQEMLARYYAPGQTPRRW